MFHSDQVRNWSAINLVKGYAPPNADRREAALARKRQEYLDCISQYYDIGDDDRSSDENEMLHQVHLIPCVTKVQVEIQMFGFWLVGFFWQLILWALFSALAIALHIVCENERQLRNKLLVIPKGKKAWVELKLMLCGVDSYGRAQDTTWGPILPTDCCSVLIITHFVHMVCISFSVDPSPSWWCFVLDIKKISICQELSFLCWAQEIFK